MICGFCNTYMKKDDRYMVKGAINAYPRDPYSYAWSVTRWPGLHGKGNPNKKCMHKACAEMEKETFKRKAFIANLRDKKELIKI